MEAPILNGVKKTGFISHLKERLGDTYPLLQQISINFQRGEMDAETYCEIALDILQGDTQTFKQLIDRLPDERVRQSVVCCLPEENRGFKTSPPQENAEASSRRESEAPVCSASSAAAQTLSNRVPHHPIQTEYLSKSSTQVPVSSSHVTTMSARPPELNNSCGGASASPQPAPRPQLSQKQPAEPLPSPPSIRDNLKEQLSHNPAPAAPQCAATSGGCPSPCPVCLDEPPDLSCKPCGHHLCTGCLQLWQYQFANPSYHIAGADPSYRTAAKRGGSLSGGKLELPCPLCRVPILAYTKLSAGTCSHPKA
ncbi:hypothetical protein CYMTET_34398 [Cymbomonas tetramitiformis]|uniref:RING-type domain-containing protein n=1 Tax=Cymbomonas tetramitiformis TaxID=36881 RepID=A0AAE0FBM1_9CHLO|nr:hypothetical protein CYMTET_34398 [Cymbomonas tetramitiformis]